MPESLDGREPYTGRTGLERIARLEYEVRDQHEDIRELKGDMKLVKEMLQQGRGMMRLVNMLLGVLVFLGINEYARPAITAALKKLGS